MADDHDLACFKEDFIIRHSIMLRLAAFFIIAIIVPITFFTFSNIRTSLNRIEHNLKDKNIRTEDSLSTVMSEHIDHPDITGKIIKDTISEISAIISSLFINSFIIIFMAFAAGYLTARSFIVQPISQLMMDIRSMFKGNRDRLDNLSGKDEVSQIAALLNNMDEQLRENIEQKIAANTANQAKNQFLANVSHEIRTPMNAIIGLTELSMNTNLNSVQFDYISKIKSSARRLMGIINDILDFSKIEAGKMELESIEFHLHDIMGNLLDIFSDKADEKGIELIINLSDELPLVLIGDPLRLEQVLVNLINNALKFTENGHISVCVETNRLPSDKFGQSCPQNISLIFSVKDTGIGIAKEKVSGLFTSFTQADGSFTRKYGGTGLGLSICKQLIKMMNGRIWVESKERQGSLFHFTANFGCIDKSEEDTEESLEAFRNMKILSVDANPGSASVVTNLFQVHNLNVESVNSGQDAIQIMESSSSNNYLVILYWKMPELDGIDITEKIKNHPALKQTQVIIITRYRRDSDMKKARDAGVDAYLIKPVNPSVLLETIKELSCRIITKKNGRKIVDSSRQILEYTAGLHVLLVEDNEINQQVAAEMLSHIGFVVDIAAHGGHAVAMLTKKNGPSYEMVFMDIQMPVMDGFEATHKIRANKKLRDIPIIAMTAHAMKGDREKCLDAGMDEYLSKPLDTNLIIEALNKMAHRFLPETAQIDRMNGKTTEKKAVKIQGPVIQNRISEDSNNIRSLPGIDIGAASRRLGGNMNLLRKILFDFSKKYSGYADSIKKAIKENHKDKACDLCHDIKGVAANISAKKLHSYASELERHVYVLNDEKIFHSISLLKSELDMVIQSIHDFDKIQKPKNPEDFFQDHTISQDHKELEEDSENISILIIDLYNLVKKNSVKSEACLEKIIFHLDDSELKNRIKPLEDQIKIFDFKGARITLEQIALFLKIDLDH